MLWWGVSVFNSPGPSQKQTFILVEKGDTLAVITRKLEQSNIISQPQVFHIFARISGAHTSLKAGEYLIEPASSQKKILDILRSGDIYLRQVTIPEGLTSYEIVRLLMKEEQLSGKISKIPEEGSLLPETYSFHRGEKRPRILSRMKKAMEENVRKLWDKRAGNIPISSPDEAVTLASIVEKETAIPQERARIAGVFINRLNKGIPLQSDPTVIYALTGGSHENEGEGPLGRRLLRKDLETDSPYNTYNNAGLPPGPIANPGKEAIKAVLNPEKHPYLYFVADGTGGHVFAKTLEEHNRNVAKWRKIRNRQRSSQ